MSERYLYDISDIGEIGLDDLVYLRVDSQFIRGVLRHVLENRHGGWNVKNLYVLASGELVLDREVISFDDLRKRVADGDVTVAPGELGTIDIRGLMWAQFCDAIPSCDDESFLSEVADIIARLQGHPGVIATCWSAFESYQTNPSVETRSALLEAYNCVPDHLKCWLGSFDDKDHPIRFALGLAAPTATTTDDNEGAG